MRRTGAAAEALLVKVAAETAGRSEASRPRSRRPFFFSPQATPAALNPLGKVTLR